MAKKTKSTHAHSALPARISAQASSHLMNTYRRPPMVFTHGRGCRLYDSHGKEYLDFLGGIAVNALGYSHPKLVRVIRREAARAIHISNLFHNAYQSPLAAKLAEWTGSDRVYFTNSGAEAVEGALKLARAYSHAKAGGPTEKTRFLALENSFHGRTFGALSITHTLKYRAPFEPLVPGVDFVRFNDVTDLEAKFNEHVCAIVIEPIQGEAGVFPVSELFWNRARALATQFDAALIADEIQCGLGRTGRKFAYQKFAAPPDIVTMAKPLAGGLPLGAVAANEQFASAFSPGMHGSTFAGGPLVCAVALELLSVLEDERLIENAHERGAEISEGIKLMITRFDFIREVRGEGLIIGVDLAVEGAPFIEAAFREGLLINCTHEHILRLLPPYIVKKKDVAEFLKKFERVLARGATNARKNAQTAVNSSAQASGPMTMAASR
ncbi:MAG TPA: aspartate aminotransferase family protein [Candidatus Aquilonibacter sp.]|nr:aspartate aminotransferase family protein [Candidatus Aquilonibacter sp.]